MKTMLDKVKFRTKAGATSTPGIVAKRPGSREYIVGNNGELNAGSKTELLATIQSLANMVQTGEVTVAGHAALSSAERQKLAAARMQETANAYYDTDDKRKWSELGATIAGELTELADREGFMRRFLSRVDVAQGQIPRIRVKSKSVTAIAASAASQFYPIQARDKYFYPPEFYIKANLRVEEREIAQATGDILEDKFFEGQEQIMVVEDRTWKKMADSLVGLPYNDLQYLAGGLSPQNVSAMQQQVNRWNLGAANLLIANDVMADITGSTAFGSWFDPVSQYEIVQTGQIGVLLGMSVVTDAFREPRLKVLNSGEVYITSSPDTHGAYSDRGPINSTPVDSYQDGVPARGWSMWELISMLLHNPRSIVKGIRS